MLIIAKYMMANDFIGYLVNIVVMNVHNFSVAKILQGHFCKYFPASKYASLQYYRVYM